MRADREPMTWMDADAPALGGEERSDETSRAETGQARRVRRLCVLLRLAVVLNRSRADDFLPPIEAELQGEALALAFPPGWLEAHPLTRADPEQERAYLGAAEIGLRFG